MDHAAQPAIRPREAEPMAQQMQRSDTHTLFTALEAEHDEVHAFVTGRLKLASLPREPEWVREAMARFWPVVLAEVDAALD